jgi:hypothetical protein
MLGLDYLGPINPLCRITKAKYFIIAVDYFSRYTWVKACKAADGKHVVKFFEEFLVPNFGFPRTLYSDNGPHFTGSPAKDYFQENGIQHLDAPISHPSSVGLVERTVQLVKSRTKAYEIELGDRGVRQWGLSAGLTMLAINTRLVKIHSFTPAEVMFRYKPKGPWLNQLQQDEEVEVEDPEDEAPHLCRLYIERRDERREQARTNMAVTHRRMEASRHPMWTKPKEGDLVLLWDAQMEKQLGRKLESRWTEPHRLVKVNPGGVSGMVSKLYGDQNNLRRIHLDDMKVYCSRSDYPDLITTAATVSYSREAMNHAGFPGQRAVDLTDY